MGKIDPALRFLAEQEQRGLAELESESEFGVAAEEAEAVTVPVLVQFSGDLAALEAADLHVRSVAGDVVTGEVALDQVEALADLDEVVRIEVSRALTHELDLALPEIRADLVHTGPPGHRGSGVIVGIIDNGIDFQHEGFRSADGSSRILALWDQSLNPQGSESSPAGFDYGVEYGKSQIDAALGAANPSSVVRHPAGAHGTHVSGIAAGDGAPGLDFVGVAPEADLVVVANTRGRAAGERGLGDSADTLDAVRYIFDFAASLGRPVVINQSQGDNVGPHDGTSLLERGIDNLLGGAGRSMVKSAGNEGSANRHASGTVTLSGTTAAGVAMPAGRTAPVTIDIWYAGADRIDLSITAPGAAASTVVTPGNSSSFALPNGNQAFVDSSVDDPGNGDNRIFVVLQRGTESTIQAGTWSLNLQGATVTVGGWDAWIQRPPPAHPSPSFLAPSVNPARTISIPGTAHKLITVASYITLGAGVGAISAFSSLGPTRDGRQAPTLAAPGQQIRSALPGNAYGLSQGTSMAAPMVAGTIALLLQRSASLTQGQIRDCLTGTAREDAFTATTPNNAWGAGKLDSAAAFGCVTPFPTLRPPCPRTLRPPCPPDTLRPPCPRDTLRPPCPDTLRPPCPPLTTRPPCLPQPSLAVPCPQPSLRVPCPQPSLRVPCPQPSLAVPCPQPSLAVPCPQPTLTPDCRGGLPGPPGPFPRGPVAEAGPTSAGWGPMWHEDPAAATWWYAPGWAQAGYDPWTQQEETAAGDWEPERGAGEDRDVEDDYTSWWHGNPGY